MEPRVDFSCSYSCNKYLLGADDVQVLPMNKIGKDSTLVEILFSGGEIDMK